MSTVSEFTVDIPTGSDTISARLLVHRTIKMRHPCMDQAGWAILSQIRGERPNFAIITRFCVSMHSSIDTSGAIPDRLADHDDHEP